MDISKDIYEYLTNFADDRTILAMLSVNKEFRSEKFFQRILQRKYPLLIKFKKDNESWKNFYIKMVYYIGKLKEEYKIPYIPEESYNPEKFYKDFYRTDGRRRAVAINYAILARRPDIAHVIIYSGFDPDRILDALVSAVKYNYFDLVKKLTDYYLETDDLYYLLNISEKYGRESISKFLKQYIQLWEADYSDE